jgi:hypothetical protein
MPQLYATLMVPPLLFFAGISAARAEWGWMLFQAAWGLLAYVVALSQRMGRGK